MNSKPHQLSDLGDLGARPSGDHLKFWGTRFMDKLPERSRFGFIFGVNGRKRQGEVPTSSFWPPGGS